jgi:hypothetical protein
MSPIGRVFIVLNLILAAGFAVTGGQLLQNQHKYKDMLNTAKAEHDEERKGLNSQIVQLQDERNKFEVASSSNQSELRAAQTQLGRVQDDNKRLSELTSSQAADLKAVRSLQQQANTDAKAAYADARKAYDASIEAAGVRDEAVRLKDSAEGENRNLKNEIASLNNTIAAKDQSIADLARDNSEQKLLVAAATQRGFIRSMAAPTLAGVVTNASGRLCTISIGDNPGNVDIQDQISRMPFTFAIYDENGYKAEAVATKYDASAKAVLCNLRFTKGAATIKNGDKASTKP